MSPSRAASSGETLPAARTGRANRRAPRRCVAARSTSCASCDAWRGQRPRRLRRDIDAHAARHDRIQQVALPKAASTVRSQCSLSRENCASPNANPASLPSAPRSPRWLAMRSTSSTSRAGRPPAGVSCSPRDPRAPGNRPMSTQPPNHRKHAPPAGDRRPAPAHRIAARFPCAHNRAVPRAAEPSRLRPKSGSDPAR